jgi:glucose-6-phosphate 1-dehydrogenase
VIRDMVQSHLTQIISLIAMEVPIEFETDQIRFEKVKALRSILPIRPEDVVLGQYTQGTVNGQSVVGYREELGIAPDSSTETFAALRLDIESWRWQGVPFYIRTGKRLAERVTQIVVTFRRPPVCLFQSLGSCQIHSNVMLITLQPNEGFSLFFDVKAPGPEIILETRPLRFQYKEVFGALPDVYHTLILDILHGDQTLFVHADETEASWKLYTSLLGKGLPVYPYPAGIWGPPEADHLLKKDGRMWWMKGSVESSETRIGGHSL